MLQLAFFMSLEQGLGHAVEFPLDLTDPFGAFMRVVFNALWKPIGPIFGQYFYPKSMCGLKFRHPICKV